MGIYQILRLWALVSIPLGVLVGKLLKANRRAVTAPRRPPPRPGDD